jgi:hypothetical protein
MSTVPIADWLESGLLGSARAMADDERMDIQASYSSFIADYKAGLLKWLEKDLSQTDEFEDQELDTLLLQVRVSKSLTQIEPFQEQPHLLDSSLQALIDPLVPFFVSAVDNGFTVKAQQCFRIMYHYTKIRGYKVTGTPFSL